jgi:hypothetical protein
LFTTFFANLPENLPKIDGKADFGVKIFINCQTRDQVVLMVTSMETWIAADREALKKQFKSGFNEKKLPSLINLESRGRKEVFDALQASTKDCGKDRQYKKGEISFKLLATLNPATLQQHLPHFQRFIAVLQHHLS